VRMTDDDVQIVVQTFNNHQKLPEKGKMR